MSSNSINKDYIPFYTGVKRANYLELQPLMGGELFDYIAKEGHMEHKYVRVIMKDLVQGVLHMNERG